MGIKRNTIANYIGQFYVAGIAIVALPLYLQYLGAEAYGLVGFFTLMQAWLALLDMGLKPTLGREVAHARGVQDGFEKFKRLLKSFELIFFSLSILIIVLIYATSDWIAFEWIKTESLEHKTISYCVGLTGFMMGMRWFAGLYRSGINGMEDQVWLNGANILLASMRYFGALILLAFLTRDIRHFFHYQLTISALEVLVLMLRFYKLLPPPKESMPLVCFDWMAVKSVAPFALCIAYTAGLWTLITQTDKLILSGLLPLSEYGFYSLVALVAGTVTTVSNPISSAILPRMTKLLAEGKREEMLRLYRFSSQLVTVISFSVSLMIGNYAEPLLFAWTGNREAAAWGKEILFWFVLGNGVVALAAFQYYLQNAFGQLRLHVIGTTLTALLQVPIIYYAARNYGALGAGVAWFGLRTFFFLTWTPFVHHTFFPGFHLSWLLRDILPRIMVVVLLLGIVKYLLPVSVVGSRAEIIAKLLIAGGIVLLISALSLVGVRRKIWEIVSHAKFKN